MLIEEYIINENNELIFNEHTLCSYTSEQGAFVVGDALVVSPKIKRIKCEFNNSLQKYYLNEQKEEIHDTMNYSSVVFTNKVSLNSICLKNHLIDNVYFLSDVTKIEGDAKYIKNKNLYIPYTALKLRKYLDTNGIKYKYL